MNRFFLLLAIFAGGFTSAHAQDPSLEDARVTLPYAELKRLMTSTVRPADDPSKPPVPAAVASTASRVVLGEEQTTLHVDVVAENLSEGWALVPLLPETLPLARVEPQEAMVLVKEGMLQLLLKGAGRRTVTLEFRLPPLGPGGLEIPIVPSPSSIVHIDGAEYVELPAISGRVTALPAEFVLASSTSILRILPPSGQASAPARWSIRSLVAASIEESHVLHKAHLELSEDTAQVNHCTLVLPEDARQIETKGNSLLRHVLHRSKGQTLVELHWKPEPASMRKLELSYLLPVTPGSAEVPIAAPTATEGDSISNWVLATTPEGMELSGSAVTGLNTSTPLPEWIHVLSQGSNAYVITGKTPVIVPLRVLDRLAANEPVVRKGVHRTRFSAEGTAVTESLFTIEHDRSLSVKLVLPPGSRLLRCVVNGEKTNPIARKDELEIPLSPRPSQSGEIAITCSSQVEKFDPVEGRIDLPCPSIPLFTDTIVWDLMLPEQYTVSAVDGDLQPNAGNAADTSVQLSKMFGDGAPRHTRIYYQRQGLSR
jgi:hypothetical protein